MEKKKKKGTLGKTPLVGGEDPGTVAGQLSDLDS